MKKIAIIAAAIAASVALLASCKSHPQVGEAEYPTKAQIDSVSYLIGINFGYFIKQNNFGEDLNWCAIKAGMNDFINSEGNFYDESFNDQFKISPELMNQLFNDFIAKKTAYDAAVAKQEGEKFLAANKNKDGVEITESGLQYKIISEGNEKRAAKDATVRVGYKGTLIDGTEFDSNEDIELNLGNVIAGWSEGMTLIGEGGEIELYIPAELGYGERNMGTIKPNSTLIFNVKLLEIKSEETEAE